MPKSSLRPALAAALLAALAVAGGCGSTERVAAPEVPSHVAADGAESSGASGPVLLACPTDRAESASVVVGPDGGTLAVGGFRVEFPAGAIAAPERFVLEVVRGDYLEIEVHAEGHPRYDFAVPVTVSLDLGRCGTLPSGLRAWHIDSQSKQLLEDMGGTVDLARRTLRFTTPHFSGYSVAW